ncbi:MAG TPA: TetR/AcrR family transcriptional regulator [Pseudonocardiaceae bacterium]|jgi:AcrR family transcriptional regulator
MSSEQVIWARPTRGARGPQPTHTREDLTAAAVRLADAEGIDAVTIRRVAAELGAAPTALYRYVSRKDELFELMMDAVAGEADPPEHSGDWRADLRLLAEHHRATALRHPWLAQVAPGRATLGPNTLRWLEFSSGVFDGHPLSADEILLNLDMVTAFIGGHVLQELGEVDIARRTGVDHERWLAAQGAYGESIITGGEYPFLTRIMIEAQAPHAHDRLERNFRLGLERILDGIATGLTS